MTKVDAQNSTKLVQKGQNHSSKSKLKKNSALQIGQQQLRVVEDNDDSNPNAGDSHKSYQDTNNVVGSGDRIQPGSANVNPVDLDGQELKDANNTV